MFELGYTALDLAASYQLGGTERFVGEWIHTRLNRDRLFLISKGGHPLPVLQPHRLTPKALTQDLEASLRRLHTDRIDLYLLHRDDPTAPLWPIAETLAAHQRQGKIGAWGISNWSHQRIVAIDALCRSAGLPPPAASSPHFSLVEWTDAPWKGCVSIAGEAERDARAFYETTQLPVLAWSPLGGGFLSDRREGRSTYDNAANAARKRRVAVLARQYQATTAQIALAYLLNQPFAVFPIVSVSTVERMRSNLRATTLRLSPSELRWLESGQD
jgi:aryl-alcohol dehydrogenase-like predicted oxidoreductase